MDELASASAPIKSSAGPGVDVKAEPSTRWVSITGVFFLGGTLVFFMLLVIAAVLRFEVPTGARFLVMIVLALGAAGSVGFLGGAAAASGSIPIPGVQDNAVAFSTTGGIAMLLIVLSLGYYLYVDPVRYQTNQIILPLPPDVSPDFNVESVSPEAIDDVGEVRTRGGRRLLFVQFVPGHNGGNIRFKVLKEGLQFELIVYEITRDGKLTKK